MPKMTGGQALARSLYREGVRVIFGLPGVQLYHALDGLAQEPGIRFIATRHEQATAYMADGYARAGGGVGTAWWCRGPDSKTRARPSARRTRRRRRCSWSPDRYSATLSAWIAVCFTK